MPVCKLIFSVEAWSLEEAKAQAKKDGYKVDIIGASKDLHEDTKRWIFVQSDDPDCGMSESKLVKVWDDSKKKYTNKCYSLIYSA